MYIRKITISLYVLVVSILNLYSQNEDFGTANNYFLKGRQFYAELQLDSALNNFQSASSIFKKNEKWENYLKCEYYSGQILLFNGSFDFALRVYENIETVSNEKIGENNEILGAAYSSLGQIYFYKADMGNALAYFDKALVVQLVLKGDSSIEVANTYNSMGNVFAQMGEYDMALEYYNKDIEIKKKVYNEDHPELATTYSNIAIIYENRGEYDKSLEIREKVLDIFINIKDENIEMAGAYSGIGSIYIKKQEYDLAKEYVLKSLEIKKKLLGEEHYKIAEDYTNLGIIYENTNELEKAEKFYFLALKIQTVNFGENHPDVAGTFNNLGLIARSKKNYSSALQYYEYALEIEKANFGDFHPQIAQIYSNIGAMYLDQKDYEQAKINIERAISISEAIYGEKHPNLVEPYMNIANIYYESNFDSLSLYYFQKSLIANIIDFNSEDYYDNPHLENYYNQNKLLESLKGKANTLVGKFDVESIENDLLMAFYIYQLCDTLVDKIRQSTTNKADKIALGVIASEMYANAISACLKLNELNPDNNYYKKYAFYFSEKNKAGTLLEAISGAQAQKFAGIPDSLLEEEKYLNDQIAYYEKQLADLPDITLEEFYRNQLFINNNKYRKLIENFELDYPKYYEMKYSTKTASVEQIQDMLDERTAMRSYFISDNYIYIFTISKADISIDISATTDDLETQMLTFNAVITSGKSQNILSYQKLAFTFYNLLFPVPINESIQRLWIIPDGILGTLPYEALFYEEYTGDIKKYKDYPYLIKKYSVSYSYSANLLYSTFNNLLVDIRPEKEWLGVAPVFEAGNLMTYGGVQVPELKGTEIEVDSIMSNFISHNFKAESLMHLEASESRFKLAKLDNYKIIHIATHGFVNSETPELSGLILAKNQITGDDGILYNGEIYNLRLNSDLVVMSACETGLGKISKGEGVIGLSRAILYAGAKNILVSFWQVSDISTSELMEYFYNFILVENTNFDYVIDFSDYLHSAKIKMIEEGVYSHPYYWSAFVLIGK